MYTNFEPLPIQEASFQILSDNWVNVDVSCNGLVLVVNEDDNQYLINPTTLNYRAIPNFHLALPVDRSFSISGLGYDFATNDYKVFTISEDDFTIGNDSIFVDVFSVRKGLWGRVECLPCEYVFEEFASGVLVNGALHWLAAKICDGSLVIVHFDLSSEKVLKLPAPIIGNLINNLAARRGCLCLFTEVEDNIVDVWTMKEYGVKDSWTKISCIVPSPLPKPAIPEREEGVAWNQYGGWFINMKDDQGKHFFFGNEDGQGNNDDDEELFAEVFCAPRRAVTFVESLVNPTFSNGT